MKSAEEILQWLLRFVEFDLRHLRAGDWLNLREDVREFLDWPTDREPVVTLEKLVIVQAEVDQALRAIDNNLNGPKPLPIPEREGSVGQRPYRRPRQTVVVHKYGVD